MSDDSDYSDEDMEMPTCHIQPYQFEPLLQVRNMQMQDNAENTIMPNVQNRMGNIDWCLCGSCKAMDTNDESRCCKEDVRSDYFEEECIKMNANFKTVCLNSEVLRTILSALNNMIGDKICFNNRSMRYAAYR